MCGPPARDQDQGDAEGEQSRRTEQTEKIALYPELMNLAGHAESHCSVVQRGHFEMLEPALISVGVDFLFKGRGEAFRRFRNVVGGI